MKRLTHQIRILSIYFCQIQTCKLYLIVNYRQSPNACLVFHQYIKRIFVVSQNYLINIIWLKRHDNSGDRFSIIWVAIIIHHLCHKLLIVLVMRQMSLYYLGQTNEYRHKNSNMNGLLLHHEQELDINVWGTCPVMATCGPLQSV